MSANSLPLPIGPDPSPEARGRRVIHGLLFQPNREDVEERNDELKELKRRFGIGQERMPGPDMVYPHKEAIKKHLEARPWNSNSLAQEIEKLFQNHLILQRQVVPD